MVFLISFFVFLPGAHASTQWIELGADDDQTVYLNEVPLLAIKNTSQQFDKNSVLPVQVKFIPRSAEANTVFYIMDIECQLGSKEYRILKYTNFDNTGEIIGTKTFENSLPFPILDGTPIDGAYSYLLLLFKDQIAL